MHGREATPPRRRSRDGARLGRRDVLVRNLVGCDRASGALTVAASVEPGQVVQFHLRAIPDLGARALATIFARNYQPMRFAEHVSPYAARPVRVPRLDLPFAATDYDRIHLPGV